MEAHWTEKAMTTCPHAWYTALPEDKMIPGFRFCRLCEAIAWESLVEMVKQGWNTSLLPQHTVLMRGPFPPKWWEFQGSALRPVFPYRIQVNLSSVPQEGLEAFYEAVSARVKGTMPTLEFRSPN